MDYPHGTGARTLATMPSYADYCPIAVGVDILGDRWTPLVIRELMVGSSRFNEIHRGVPKMSRSLLAQRLRMLERNDIVRRQVSERGRPGRYELTPAGEALTPIVWAMGQWAAEWKFGDPTEEEADALTLLWRMHQHAVADRLPSSRTVIHLVLTGPGGAQGWFDIDEATMTICKEDPGYDVDLAVEADTAQMQRWLVGLVPFSQLVRSGDARLLGPSKLARAFPTWFDTTLFEEGLARRRSRERRRRVA